MAGHSKWANIKHRKNAQDAKRGKVFTKLIREITVSAKVGGGVVEDNPRLRIAVDKALCANMTKDTIERAIKRGVGDDNNENLEEVIYEGYGPGGIAVLVYTLTDNRNRTVSEVRHAFTKAGGNLGTDGSVSYLFQKRGELYFAAGTDENQLLEIALDAGADDVQTFDDGSSEIITSPDAFNAVKLALSASKLEPELADISFSAALQVTVDDVEVATKVYRLLERLEDLDDVQEVYSNADFPESFIMAAMASS